MKNETGISLLALIITIIVIIILAAAVIGTSLKTPESARYAKFCSDVSGLQEVISNTYYDEYMKQMMSTNTAESKETIYSNIAKGSKTEDITTTEIPIGVLGSIAYKIQDATKVPGYEKIPEYTSDFYVTNEGNVFLKEGYIYGEEKYYTATVKTDSSIENPGGETSNPSYSFRIENGAASTIKSTVTLTLEAPDTTTEICVTETSSDTAPLTGWIPYTQNPTYKLSTGLGEKTIYVWFKEGDSTEKATSMIDSELLADGTWDAERGVNSPKLVTGMKAVYFETNGTEVTSDSDNFDKDKWYNYNENKTWANALTKDSSGNVTGYWVWIPRYEYKINTSSKTTTVNFIPTSQTVVTLGSDYAHVHPAFRNSPTANGGWDTEISGIWVSKFEAGYAMGGRDITGGNQAMPKESNFYYTENSVFAAAPEANNGVWEKSISARNWLNGIYGSTVQKICYPVFTGKTISMTYIRENDIYNICKLLDDPGNIYGFDISARAHLIKNSEWGAVAYLSKSQCGLGSTDIFINNVTLNSGNIATEAPENKLASAYAVTGYAASSKDAGTNTINAGTTVLGDVLLGDNGQSFAWYTTNGQKASSNGNISGVYDMSGGEAERVSTFVDNGHGNINNGQSLIAGGSNVYAMEYVSAENGTSDINVASQLNFEANKSIYGDAVAETSTEGTGNSSWYGDASWFPGTWAPFASRGGAWNNGSNAGILSYTRNAGNTQYDYGFRATLCP